MKTAIRPSKCRSAAACRHRREMNARIDELFESVDADKRTAGEAGLDVPAALAKATRFAERILRSEAQMAKLEEGLIVAGSNRDSYVHIFGVPLTATLGTTGFAIPPPPPAKAGDLELRGTEQDWSQETMRWFYQTYVPTFHSGELELSAIRAAAEPQLGQKGGFLRRLLDSVDRHFAWRSEFAQLMHAHPLRESVATKSLNELASDFTSPSGLVNTVFRLMQFLAALDGAHVAEQEHVDAGKSAEEADLLSDVVSNATLVPEGTRALDVPRRVYPTLGDSAPNFVTALDGTEITAVKLASMALGDLAATLRWFMYALHWVAPVQVIQKIVCAGYILSRVPWENTNKRAVFYKENGSFDRAGNDAKFAYDGKGDYYDLEIHVGTGKFDLFEATRFGIPLHATEHDKKAFARLHSVRIVIDEDEKATKAFGKVEEGAIHPLWKAANEALSRVSSEYFRTRSSKKKEYADEIRNGGNASMPINWHVMRPAELNVLIRTRSAKAPSGKPSFLMDYGNTVSDVITIRAIADAATKGVGVFMTPKKGKDGKDIPVPKWYVGVQNLVESNSERAGEIAGQFKAFATLPLERMGIAGEGRQKSVAILLKKVDTYDVGWLRERFMNSLFLAECERVRLTFVGKTEARVKLRDNYGLATELHYATSTQPSTPGFAETVLDFSLRLPKADVAKYKAFFENTEKRKKDVSQFHTLRLGALPDGFFGSSPAIEFARMPSLTDLYVQGVSVAMLEGMLSRLLTEAVLPKLKTLHLSSADKDVLRQLEETITNYAAGSEENGNWLARLEVEYEMETLNGVSATTFTDVLAYQERFIGWEAPFDVTKHYADKVPATLRDWPALPAPAPVLLLRGGYAPTQPRTDDGAKRRRLASARAVPVVDCTRLLLAAKGPHRTVNTIGKLVAYLARGNDSLLASAFRGVGPDVVFPYTGRAAPVVLAVELSGVALSDDGLDALALLENVTVIFAELNRAGEFKQAVAGSTVRILSALLGAVKGTRQYDAFKNTVSFMRFLLREPSTGDVRIVRGSYEVNESNDVNEPRYVSIPNIARPRAADAELTAAWLDILDTLTFIVRRGNTAEHNLKKKLTDYDDPVAQRTA